MKVDLKMVIKEITKRYQEDKGNKSIKKPMAHALYVVWRKVDVWEKER